MDVYIIELDNSEGNVKLSKVKADRIKAWEQLAESVELKTPVTGKVLEVVKGGLVVAVQGLRGFIPASHVALHHVDDMNQFVGQELTLVPIEVEASRNKLVLSRKVLLKEEELALEEKIYGSIQPGDLINGTVRRIANFGVFVDIGGVDGLVHISDLAWHRVN